MSHGRPSGTFSSACRTSRPESSGARRARLGGQRVRVRVGVVGHAGVANGSGIGYLRGGSLKHHPRHWLGAPWRGGRPLVVTRASNRPEPPGAPCVGAGARARGLGWGASLPACLSTCRARPSGASDHAWRAGQVSMRVLRLERHHGEGVARVLAGHQLVRPLGPVVLAARAHVQHAALEREQQRLREVAASVQQQPGRGRAGARVKRSVQQQPGQGQG